MRKIKFALLAILALAVVLLVLFLSRNGLFAVLTPKGLIAHQERQLMIIATALMLLVVVPVFALTIWISWKYRAGNTHAEYKPDWDGNALAELAWWAVPCIIIGILAV